VELARRSLALVLDRATLVLCGGGDMVIAQALHHRTLGPDKPFIVCDPRRLTSAASVRSPESRATGVAAFEAAIAARCTCACAGFRRTSRRSWRGSVARTTCCASSAPASSPTIHLSYCRHRSPCHRSPGAGPHHRGICRRRDRRAGRIAIELCGRRSRVGERSRRVIARQDRGGHAAAGHAPHIAQPVPTRPHGLGARRSAARLAIGGGLGPAAGPWPAAG
jgi:hypothetical protein